MKSDFNQMLNLHEVFYYILKRWRNIILFGLIGGILFGGFTFLRMKKNSTTIEDLSNTPKYTIENLTDKENQKIEEDILQHDAKVLQIKSRLEFLNNRFRTLNEKIANSLYLSMSDTEQFFYEFDINMKLTIKDDIDQSEIDEILRELMVKYNSQFSSESFFKYIAFQTDFLVPQNQVRELVQSNIGTNNNIHIVLTAPEDILGSLTEAVKLYIKTEADDTILLSQNFETEIINDVESIGSNEAVQNQLAEINEQITALSSEIDQNETELEERINEAKLEFSEKYLENKLNQEKKIESPSQVKKGSSKKLLVLYILVGICLGAILVIIWYIYKLMSSKNIIDINEINNNLGLMVINQIYIEDKSASKIDNWINAKYLKREKNVSNSLADQVSYTKTLIEVLIKKDNSELTDSKMYKVGMAGEITDYQSVELIDQFEDNDLFSVSKLSLSLNSETELRKMNDVSSIVLVIKTHYTEVNEILHFIELAKDMNKEILGAVSLECL